MDRRWWRGGAGGSRVLGLAPRASAAVAAPASKISGFGVGATLARARGVDDYDPTDPVFVGLPEIDDSPTSPIVVLEDHTTRQRCEFEEDTVEEFFV